MAAEQDFGDVPAVEHLGAGIDGCLDKPILEGVAQGALLVSDGSRQQTHHGIGDDRGRQFAAREHIVTNGDFLGNQVLANAVVHTLVVATQDHDVLLERQGIGHGLVELLTVGRGKDDFIILALAFQLLHATPHGLNLHHHARLATKGVIIHLAVLAQAPVAQVVHVNLHQALVLGPLQDGGVQRRLECVGHYCQYIDSHLAISC